MWLQKWPYSFSEKDIRLSDPTHGGIVLIPRLIGRLICGHERVERKRGDVIDLIVVQTLKWALIFALWLGNELWSLIIGCEMNFDLWSLIPCLRPTSSIWMTWVVSGWSTDPSTRDILLMEAARESGFGLPSPRRPCRFINLLISN